MSDKPSETPGILTLDMVGVSTKTFNIALSIPPQTITLTGYRIEYLSPVAALAKAVALIDLPFLSGNQVLDGNVGHVFLPLLLDNSMVTIRDGLNIPIYVNQTIPQVFDMAIRNSSNFVLDGDALRVTLTFSLTHGHLS